MNSVPSLIAECKVPNMSLSSNPGNQPLTPANIHIKITDFIRSRGKNSGSPELQAPEKRKRLLSPRAAGAMDENGKPVEGESGDVDFVVDPAIDQYFEKKFEVMLAKAVQPHLEMIEKLNAVILAKDKEIEELRKQLAEKPAPASTPSTEHNDSQCESQGAFQKRVRDEIEYRLRKKQLRITNVDASMGTDAEAIVCNIGNAIGVNITPADFDDCHFLGKPSDNNKRNIIVEFITSRLKRRFISSRKKLRESEDFKLVYINESLSKTRYELLRYLLGQRKNGTIHSAWSFSGVVYFRCKEGDEATKVKYPTDFDLNAHS